MSDARATITTWQKQGRSQYVKVEKTVASKDEELNEEADGLITSLTSADPSFPATIAEIITISEITRSTAWGGNIHKNRGD